MMQTITLLRDKNGRYIFAFVVTFVLLLLVVMFFLEGSNPLPAELDLSEVQTVTIQDRWAGLSPISPIDASYDLIQINGELRGNATFAVANNGDVREEGITVPAEGVRDFVTILQRAVLIAGNYTPLIEHTDDYPYITITILTPNDRIEVFSQSQGDGHKPWGATVHGQEYTIETDIPQQALNALNRYMKRDILEGMFEDAWEASGWDS
jgi:hypothetical protein